MKTYKKIISLIVTLSLFTTLSVGTYGNSVTALELTKQKKISSVLLKEMDDLKRNETVPIYVEFEGIEKDFIEQKVDEQTGMTLTQIEQLEDKYLNSEELNNASNEELDTLLPKYFKNTESKREYIQSLVNKRIMTERSIAKKLYDKQNEEYVEQTGIDKTNIEFVSSYSPMVITECTENEIDDIVVQSKVKSIDIHEDVKIVPEENQISKTEAETTAASSTSYTTAWKSAISVDITTNSLGIKGSGVTIGVFDADTVDINHSDLKNTDITVLDKTVDYETYHGTKVTRILAGSYGIVPEAKIYSCSNIASESAIETLIGKGVSLINISLNFGTRSNDYYTSFEKWLDYISYVHNVLIVKTSGNVSTAGINCNIGALAYNVLTVGGIDTKNTSIKSDDEFHTGVSYANGGAKGCAKPDCEAAFNDVLELGYEGTSFAAPAVTGVCAQIIQTEPTLAFHPDTVKAIILASCDRKCSESYTEGLTEKEGSGVVNAQRAIKILSVGTYTILYTTGNNREVILRNNSDYRKCALTWPVLASTVSNIEIPNFKFELYDKNSNNYIGTNLPNSSAEVLVTNAFQGTNVSYNYLSFNFLREDDGTSNLKLSAAWYDL